MNIVEKILAAHSAPSTSPDASGNEAGITIDQVMLQDTAGPMAFLQFEAMNIPKIQAKRSLTFVDHQTLQDGFENADDHAYLASAAKRFGAIFSPAGNGICHQLILERFSRPGWTMIGTDSHTPTAGGVGMLAIGAGGLDVAVAMGGGPFFMPAPKVIKIELQGALRPWATAKDVVLEVLRQLTVKGNVGYIIEYGGDGVATLSVPERGTISNMGTELGVTTSIFPSDTVTREFFRLQKREHDWVELVADPGAGYDKTITIDLATIVPSVALPHSPGNVTTLQELAAKETVTVDQVLIGSCTNSSYRDLMITTKLLKGRRIAPGVSLGIAPGSRQVLHMIAANGALADMVAAGARILESACGFCCGCGQAPKSQGISVRTSNRNFAGRTGTADAKAYLVSPESAAVAALTGILADPSEAGFAYPPHDTPTEYYVDDTMFIMPSFDGEIIRGPNIGKPPATPIPTENMTLTAAAVFGDNITTDHILPAGSLMKLRSNIARYSDYVFHGIDPEFPTRCKAISATGKGALIIGGESYGQGSSREHAAICPMHLGVRAVLAKSMERIHRANLINFGVLPLFFVNPADHERCTAGDEFALCDIPAIVISGKGSIRNVTRNVDIPVAIPLSERQKDILRHGGLLAYTCSYKHVS